MDYKYFSCNRVYFKWKTELPTVLETRRSSSFFFNDIEWSIDLEAKYDQVYNLMPNLYVVGNTMWNLCLKRNTVSASQEKEHVMQMTVYMQDKDGVLEYLGVKTKFKEIIWSTYESDIFYHKMDFIVNGCLTFIFIFDKPLESISDLERRTEADRRDNHLSCHDQFAEDIKGLLTNMEHCDVVMTCDDLKSFNTHKCILAARSDMFAAMFRSNMSECHDGVVYIRDTDSSVFGQLLKYIYSGKTDELKLEMASALYEAADKYAVHSLRRKCAVVLMQNLTEENVFNSFYIAEKFSDEELMEASVSFVAGRREFLRSTEWKTFAEQHPVIGNKVYQRALDLLLSV